MSDQTPFAGYAIVELMGHRRVAGFVEDVELFGGRMMKVTVPSTDQDSEPSVQFYSPTALYSLLPCTEERARADAIGYGGYRPALPIGRSTDYHHDQDTLNDNDTDDVGDDGEQDDEPDAEGF